MSSNPQNKSDAELLELGKKLQTFYKTGYISKGQAFFFSFLNGVFSGFGAVVGGTLVVALLLWALSNFKEIPFIGPISDAVRSSIQSKR